MFLIFYSGIFSCIWIPAKGCDRPIYLNWSGHLCSFCHASFLSTCQRIYY